MACGRLVLISVLLSRGPLCVCLYIYKDTHHWIRAHLIQYDLILTNYICKDLISKQSQPLRFQANMKFVDTPSDLVESLFGTGGISQES